MYIDAISLFNHSESEFQTDVFQNNPFLLFSASTMSEILGLHLFQLRPLAAEKDCFAVFVEAQHIEPHNFTSQTLTSIQFLDILCSFADNV